MTRSTRQSLVHLLVCLASLAVPHVLTAAEAAKKTELQTFELPDQFGDNHRYEFPRKRPLIILIGDRKGSEEVDAWIAPLKKHFASSADITGIADMRGVPRFLRDRITAAIKKNRPVPVMLDYDGIVTDRLPCVRKVANVFVVGPQGDLVGTVSGAFDDQRIEALQKVMRAAALPEQGAK